MNITSKQRAYLRSLSQTIDTIAQFGKGELSEQQVEMVDRALTKRELIKCRVLETSPYTPRELCDMLSQKTNAIGVLVIGSKFVLFRRNSENPVIQLD